MADDRPATGRISRRTYVAIAGGVAAGLAGCSGSDDGDTPTEESDGTPGNGADEPTDTGSGGDGDDFVDVYMRVNNLGEPASQSEYNYYAGNANWKTGSMLSAQPAFYSSVHDEFYPLAAEDWEFADDEFHVTWKDGLLWSDGTEVTGESYRIYRELTTRMIPQEDRPDNPLVTGYDSDGRTTIFQLNEDGYSPDAVRHDILDSIIYDQIPPNHQTDGVFAEKLEAIRDASSQNERDSVREEVLDVSLKLPDVVLSGPYVPVDATSEQATFEVNRDDVQGKELNWAGLKVPFIGDVEKSQMIITDQTEVINDATSPDASLPDHYTALLSPEPGGTGLGFNFEPGDEDPTHGLITEPTFRQAIAHVINRENAAANANPIFPAVEIPAGIPSSNITDTHGDLVDQLNRYETDTDRAASLLKEAGAEESGGEWVASNGEPITLPIVSANFPGDAELAQSIEAALSAFGFKTELSVLDGPTMTNRIDNDNFVLNVAGWGGSPLPGMAFQGVFGLDNAQNTPKTIEAPGTVGDWDSGLESYDVRTMVNDLATMTDDEQIRETVGKLVWVFNYALPVIPIFQEIKGTQINSTHFDWPPFPEESMDANEQFKMVTTEDPPIYGAGTGFNDGFWYLAKGYPTGEVSAKEQ